MKLNKRDWAKATAAREDDAHARRIGKCSNIEYLRAAVKYEASRLRGTRQERVARINQRLKQLR